MSLILSVSRLLLNFQSTLPLSKGWNSKIEEWSELLPGLNMKLHLTRFLRSKCNPINIFVQKPKHIFIWYWTYELWDYSYSRGQIFVHCQTDDWFGQMSVHTHVFFLKITKTQWNIRIFDNDKFYIKKCKRHELPPPTIYAKGTIYAGLSICS